MKDRIQLLVGLGNPGAKYEGTRHNAGEDLVRQFAARQQVTLKAEARFKGVLGRLQCPDQTALHILIPSTYMNLSGESVAGVARFYQIPPEHILVAHDELDLQAGVARFKQGGGHGGHNGLRDMIEKLGHNRNFYRIRVGIGHPGHAREVSSYVLGKARPEEQQLQRIAQEHVLDVLPLALAGNWQKAMQQLHSQKC